MFFIYHPQKKRRNKQKQKSISIKNKVIFRTKQKQKTNERHEKQGRFYDPLRIIKHISSQRIKKAQLSFAKLESFKKWRICLILTGFFLLWERSFCFAQQSTENLIDEDAYIPSFRPGHNLSFLLSGEAINWRMSQHNGAAITSDEMINSVHQTKSTSAFYMRYSYHFNVLSGFGFFLGSSFGFIPDTGSYGATDNFQPGYGVQLPTVAAGIVQNISLNWRFYSGVEYGALWFPDMKVTTVSGRIHDLAAVTNMFSVFAAIDSFGIIGPNTAISLLAGGRWITKPCLDRCSNSNYLNSLSISATEVYTQIGVTWLLFNDVY